MCCIVFQHVHVNQLNDSCMPTIQEFDNFTLDNWRFTFLSKKKIARVTQDPDTENIFSIPVKNWLDNMIPVVYKRNRNITCACVIFYHMLCLWILPTILMIFIFDDLYCYHVYVLLYAIRFNGQMLLKWLITFIANNISY